VCVCVFVYIKIHKEPCNLSVFNQYKLL